MKTKLVLKEVKNGWVVEIPATIQPPIYAGQAIGLNQILPAVQPPDTFVFNDTNSLCEFLRNFLAPKP